MKKSNVDQNKIISENTGGRRNKKKLAKKLDKLNKEGWEVDQATTSNFFRKTTIILKKKQ